MLFGPANRVDFVPKFVAAGADIGVLDLEDAVAESGKQAARDALVDNAPGAGELGTMRLFVRVNAIDSSHFTEDMAAAAEAGAVGVVVPKLEDGPGVNHVRSAMTELGIGQLCAGIESAAGVDRATEIARERIDLLYFGAEDFITDMGGVRTEGNDEVLYARSKVALAARLGQVPALDQVVVDYNDGARFEQEAAVARSLGYSGKLCIHPNQVALANAAFTPTEEELAWAHGVLAAAEAAEAVGTGVISYEGVMVDAPILVRARALIDRATD